MNKKILITLFLITMLIIISLILFSSFNNTEKDTENLISTEECVLDINDTYVKLDSSNIDQEKCLKTAEKHLNNYNFINEEIDTSEIKLEVYKDNLNSLTEIVISNSDMIAKINNTTGDLISYINQKSTFSKNTLSETEVKQVALDIFNNIDNIQDYEMISLTQFDDEIHQAKFCKKYGEYTNPGELISFSFAPETGEVLTFAKKSVPFANNSIQVSEIDSRNTAQEYLGQTSTDNITISIEIVAPNHNLENSLEYNQVYKNANETRLAYVYTFNNTTQIYIDCTTGKPIGSTQILKSEF